LQLRLELSLEDGEELLLLCIGGGACSGAWEHRTLCMIHLDGPSVQRHSSREGVGSEGQLLVLKLDEGKFGRLVGLSSDLQGGDRPDRREDRPQFLLRRLRIYISDVHRASDLFFQRLTLFLG